MKRKTYYHNLIAESLKAEFCLDVSISFKAINRGYARENSVSIPLWSLTNKFYGIYYVIHELSHAILAKQKLGYGHGKNFKELETSLLKRFNIIPEYAKSYAKKLWNSEGILLADYKMEARTWTK